MYVYTVFALFILGAVLGSFYNVVGYRLPKGESIVSPPSHCTKCGSRLGATELIPIISYFLLKGKCKHCGTKVSAFYTVFEILTGLLFVLAFVSYGYSLDLIIALTFISMLIIIVVSDYNYMIISDEVLIFFSVLLGTEIFFIHGSSELINSIISAVTAFVTMLLIKIGGDKMFKRESMGGGDIKLMFTFGLVLGYPMTIVSIFLGSIVGLIVSLITIKKNPEHIIPFGPFLAAGALIVILFQITPDTLLSIYNI